MPWKVKLHLFGEADYTKFLELMTPFILKTETLDNYYLDGDYQELYAHFSREQPLIVGPRNDSGLMILV